MAADTEQQDLEAGGGLPPQPLERGRYAVFQAPDGGWMIARAGPLCKNCGSCDCGEQQDPIAVPPMVVNLITGQSQLPGPLQAMLGKVMGNGR